MTRLLIMDYSTDRAEHKLILQWMPRQLAVDICLVLDRDPIPPPDRYTHIVHTGSALSIMEDAVFLADAGDLIRNAVAGGVFQMGICYGHQLLSRILVGSHAVRRCPGGGEAGWIDVDFTKRGRAFFRCGSTCRIFQYHYDEVTAIPVDSVLLAFSKTTAIQAYVDPVKNLLGMQFHPEFDMDSGNRQFALAAERLVREGRDVGAILKSGPAGFDTTAVFGRLIRHGTQI